MTQGPYLGPPSADGRFVFFTKDQGRSLWKAPLEGGEETLVLDSPVEGRFAAVEKGIYFFAPWGPRGNLCIKFYEFSGKTVKPVAEVPNAAPGYGLDVSVDGHSILYTQEDQNVWDLMLAENFR